MEQTPATVSSVDVSESKHMFLVRHGSLCAELKANGILLCLGDVESLLVTAVVVSAKETMNLAHFVCWYYGKPSDF